SNANDAALIQIAEHVLTDVRNVARDLFRTKLRIARFDFELFDVNRGVVVLFHKSLGNENRVFEVVTAPRHERAENVASECELTAVGTWTIRDDLSLRDALTDVNDRTLIDTSVLVRTLEL